ncbi:hypothetical protein LguiA_003119 [Lonicera macranthoides]
MAIFRVLCVIQGIKEKEEEEEEEEKDDDDDDDDDDDENGNTIGEPGGGGGRGEISQLMELPPERPQDPLLDRLFMVRNPLSYHHRDVLMVLSGCQLPFQSPEMSSTIFISRDEFNLFHSIDRKLYALLVTDLTRDPVESMQTMALWLWLERVGFSHVIKRILSLPHTIISGLADEASTCLNCITNSHEVLGEQEGVGEIPLTQNLMKKEISLQFFQENRSIAIRGIAKVSNEVCNTALADIMERVLKLTNNAQKRSHQRILTASQAVDDSFVNGFSQLRLDEESKEVGKLVPADDRTMFVTFSKGYPVEEFEVRDFFTRIFEDCIESFYMQEVKPQDEQALFAKIVFYFPSIIDVILNGVAKAKFNINGKHVWLRKFVPKRPRSTVSPPSSPPQNMPGTF